MGDLATWVAEYGASVVFVLAILETCFVTGLVVPSGMSAAAAAAISVGAPAEIIEVGLAAIAGGFIGDVVGYWIGRRGGTRLLEGKGWVGATLRKHDSAAQKLLGRKPLFSVTFARLVSFVRTLMPISAGMARVPFGTYLLHEVPGVVLWALLYVGIGVFAGESWQLVSGAVGAGWLVVFGVVGAVLWMRARRTGADAGGGAS